MEPSFKSFIRWYNTPQNGMTTFAFLSIGESGSGNFAQLLNFGEELDPTSGTLVEVVAMQPSANVSTQTLSLTFDHFNDTLLFDPGTGDHRWRPTNSRHGWSHHRYDWETSQILACCSARNPAAVEAMKA